MGSRSTTSDASAAVEREVLSRSAAETRALAARLAGAARAGDHVALYGPLGAGKTEFAKGFAAGLGVPGVVNSPSFVLMAEHRGRLPFFHLDLYRLGGPREAIEGGLVDERRSTGVTVVEWADRLQGILPEDRLSVRIDGSGDEPRHIVLTGSGSHRRYLEDLAEAAP